jgi:hypothetical protein
VVIGPPPKASPSLLRFSLAAAPVQLSERQRRAGSPAAPTDTDALGAPARGSRAGSALLGGNMTPGGSEGTRRLLAAGVLAPGPVAGRTPTRTPRGGEGLQREGFYALQGLQGLQGLHSARSQPDLLGPGALGGHGGHGAHSGSGGAGGAPSLGDLPMYEHWEWSAEEVSPAPRASALSLRRACTTLL